MKVKPFHKQSEYTMMSNAILDSLMPILSGSEWKVLTVIIRKTVGWHETLDKMSFNEIKKRTGIGSNTTISNAIKKLEKEGIIIVERPSVDSSDPALSQVSNTYILNMDFEIEIEASPKNGQGVVQKVDKASPENGPEASPKNGQGVVQKMETLKRKSLNKDLNKGREKAGDLVGEKRIVDNPESSPPPAIKIYTELTEIIPAGVVQERVGESVGNSQANLKRWRETIIGWLACGWNPGNIGGILECFEREEIPTTGNRRRSNETNKRTNGSVAANHRAGDGGAGLDPAPITPDKWQSFRNT